MGVQVEISRGRRGVHKVCPCGQGCEYGSAEYNEHYAEYAREYKRQWMAAKREAERAQLEEVVTIADPGNIGMGKPKQNEIRLCYCGCGARAGSIEYERHYNKKYERERIARQSNEQKNARKAAKAGSQPIWIAWRGN